MLRSVSLFDTEMAPLKRFSALFPALLCILLMAYVLAGTVLTPFHGDESTQIYMSRDYAYVAFKGDWAEVLYSDTPRNITEQHLRLLNGTLNKYLIGLSWHLAGFTLSDINDQWDWGGDWSYNQNNGHAPSPELLLIARLPSALFLAAGVLLIYALGVKLNGRWAGLIAVVLYGLHPALLLNGRRAMMEGSLIFFTLLTVMSAIWWLERRTLFRALLLGLAAGLAVASKHTALFTIVPIFAACLFVLILTRRKSPVNLDHGLRDELGRLPISPIHQTLSSHHHRSPMKLTSPLHFLLLIIAGITATSVFYVLNPAWWGDPFSRIGQVFVLRQELLAGQTAAFGGYADIGAAVEGFIRQIFFTQPQYYEVPSWADFIGFQIVQYETSGLRGLSVGDNPLLALSAAAILMAGVVVLMRTRGAVKWVIGVWMLSTVGSTLVFTPLEWQRYYLPVYPLQMLLIAAGLTQMIRTVYTNSRPLETVGYVPNS